ncbi:hypothetical protein Tco_0694848 [Tanacetum coccineum]
MFVFFVNSLLQNTMAEQNVPTQPPTRTDEQIVPRSQWLIIEKIKLLFNAQKIQKNPIFQISEGTSLNSASTKNLSKAKLPQKVRKGKPTFQLVDEDDEAQQESVLQEEGDDPDLELAKKMSLEAHQEKGEGEGDDADMERAIKLSLDPAFLPQGRAPVGGVTIRDPVSETTPKLPEVVGKGKAIVTEEQVAHSLIDLSKKKRGNSVQRKVIHESSSTSDSERTESETEAAAPKGNKDQGEVDSSRVTSGVSIPVSTQGQAGSDPEKAHEALAGPDPEPMKKTRLDQNLEKDIVSLAGPNPGTG